MPEPLPQGAVQLVKINFDKLVDGGASSPATATPLTHRNLRFAEVPAAPPGIHWIPAGWSRLRKVQ